MKTSDEPIKLPSDAAGDGEDTVRRFVLDTSRERADFIRDHQLRGGTYLGALEIWQASVEIADAFGHEELLSGEISEGEIRDAISDWYAIRRAGL